MSGLSFVEPVQSPTVNTLIYGGPGSGKTVAACSAPGPVLVVNAEGPSALIYARRKYGNKHVREVAVTGKQTLTDVVLALRTPGHGFKTVVVDTVGEVFRLVLDEIAAGQKPQIQHFGDATKLLERFTLALRDEPVNVVFVCHELTEANGETQEVEHLPLFGTSNAVPGRKLAARCDVVAFAAVRQEGERVEYVGQLVNGRGRVGKDRFGVLGKFRPLDLSEWFALCAEPVGRSARRAAPESTVEVEA